ncbi:MAG TPA: hypothetical protein VF590_25705 [Isosphaeraceae bacterium]
MRGIMKPAVLAGLIGMAGLGGAGAPAADHPVTTADDLSWVEQRVRDWQPTPQERRFDEIGWAPSIREAERLAREHGRPVFLFTHDGHMAIGRC